MEAQGLEKGREQGREQDIQTGAHQKTIDIALKMLKEGTDLAFITKITGLSSEDLGRLQKTKVTA